MKRSYAVIVVGAGHAGVEAAWACANMLRDVGSVGLVTLDPAKTGVMSCNPAIGGLAKGQLVREIDAMSGLMGLAADATGIHFKMLNTSKGPAVWGPRCQSDKIAYAAFIREQIESRAEIDVVCGSAERFVIEGDGLDARRLTGVVIKDPSGAERTFHTRAAILTTGTFMRGLMHRGSARTPGGRAGEAAASGMSGTLRELGFELGRLKTGTPPRVRRGSIDWESLPEQPGDDVPTPFSELNAADPGWSPPLEQVECRQTQTSAEVHDRIRENLHLAPMYNGRIESRGPRYCPSIEDKVVRFPDRTSHGVFLEPESLQTDWVYFNGISTSLPDEVQREIVAGLPGCANAEILQFGYAVEYDCVRPHQIHATGMTKSIEGLFLAGQINGTSGYEEAGAQGLVAGVNAVRLIRGESEWVVGRDEGYIGVLMDDLVTKTPVEPYRMFTSRAEHRLLLRPDNACDRLTPMAERLGLLGGDRGAARLAAFRARRDGMASLNNAIDAGNVDGEPVSLQVKRAAFGQDQLRAFADAQGIDIGAAALRSVLADRKYEGLLGRQRAEVRRHAAMERRRMPPWFIDRVRHGRGDGLRSETREAIGRFRPSTFGQAGRLEGVTAADLTLLSVLLHRAHERGPEQAPGRADHGVVGS